MGCGVMCVAPNSRAVGRAGQPAVEIDGRSCWPTLELSRDSTKRLSRAFSDQWRSRRRVCTIYVTLEPCAMCAGALVNQAASSGWSSELSDPKARLLWHVLA